MNLDKLDIEGEVFAGQGMVRVERDLCVGDVCDLNDEGLTILLAKLQLLTHLWIKVRWKFVPWNG